MNREAKGREHGTEGEEDPYKSKICRGRDVHAGTCTSYLPATCQARQGRAAQLNRSECPYNAALNQRKGGGIQKIAIYSNPPDHMASSEAPQSVAGDISSMQNNLQKRVIKTGAQIRSSRR